MNDTLRWLLDLDTLRLSAQGVELGFERPLPAWAWGGVIGAAVIVSLWSYWRMAGPVAARTLLGCSRALLLLTLVVLVCGPRLVQRSESLERDWVLVLLDRSASLSIADVEEAGAPGGGRVTREAQLREALQKSWPMWSGLAKDRVVVWMGFDGGAFDLSPVASRPDAAASADAIGIELGPDDGQRTSLGAALDQALARAAARPLSAVVIISDGKSVTEPARASLRRLQSERVPVHVVPLGSEKPLGDVAVRRVEAPRFAFTGDQTPVRVDLERLGGSDEASTVIVKLIDAATTQVLAERRVTLDSAEQQVTLLTKGAEAGGRTWRVEITTDQPDLVAGNNASEFGVELVDRPLRVLYIDGYPRWEQRYLRNLLLREKSINCSTLILAPDRRYIQESDTEIDALPDSPEQWAEYDAVVLGDVLPDVFTDEQLAQLRDHVATRGGGLLWIGGPAATPAAWWETPLADLFPFTRQGNDGSAIGEPIVLTPTDAARRLGLLQLGESAENPWPSELSDLNVAWSHLRWAQRIDPRGLKPTAEVLALSEPFGTPVVLSMRYGAGRVLYVGTDEIWRWRYGRGETLPERFWLQMIRLMGREGLARSGRPAVLTATPRRSDVGQPVRVALELLDQSLADDAPPTLAVRLARTPRTGESAESASTTELILRPEAEDARLYTAVWLPEEPGRWTARATDRLLAGVDLSADVEVTLPDDELRRPETDHPALARLSQETGGVVLKTSDLSELAEHLPNRSRRLLNEVAEPLWDTPLALLLVVLLATFEWVGRRVIRLI